MPSAVNIAWLIPLFPLAGAVFLLLLGKRVGRGAGAIATLMMAGSFVTGVVALVWSKNPTWTYRQVIAQVLATADKSAALQGCTNGSPQAASTSRSISGSTHCRS